VLLDEKQYFYRVMTRPGVEFRATENAPAGLMFRRDLSELVPEGQKVAPGASPAGTVSSLFRGLPGLGSPGPGALLQPKNEI
jgi:hypothetical protein